MHARITDLLPVTSLRDMNLEQELVIQYQNLKNLQSRTLEDPDVAPNQKAQVANSVGATLQSLAKMQGEMYSAERFKQIEMALITLLNTWPRETTVGFFAQYEAIRI